MAHPSAPRAALLTAALLAVARLAAAEGAAGGDDAYRFLTGDEQAVTLAPAGDGLRLDWPSGPWDTALVGLRVVASGPEPRVELRAGAISIVQHFDAGARGRRFLNPTSLRPALAAGTALELLPRDVTLDPSATLRRFSNRLDLRRPLLVLAPHPDDAELAAFGLYAASANATIVTITSGNAGDANYQDYFPGDVPGQYLFKGYLRAVDSVTVPWQGGVPPERCANLGYFDARLAQMHARPRDVVPEMYGPNDDVGPYRRANLGRLVPSGPRGNSWANLVADLETLLRRVRPEVVVTPHPWLDTHPDHQYVTVALAEALARWKRPATFLLYTNHAGENLYPYGPAGGVVSLPPWTGPELESSSVYAHPLGPDVRRRKLFALESMHDLRLSPSEQSSCADAGAPRRPDYPRTPAVDYFRRGPRSEELFFVFDRAGLLRLVDAFLAREAAR